MLVKLNRMSLSLLMAAVVLILFLLPGLLTDYDRPFINGFESGKVDPADWLYDGDGNGGCEINITGDNVREGAFSAQFHAKKGARCELVPLVHSGPLGKYIHEPFGEDRWYEFSVYLEEPWELSEQNEVIAQWHGAREKFLFEKGGRGPPLALRIISRAWYITYGWDADFVSEPGAKASKILWYGSLDTGRWVSWVFKIRWDYGGDGQITVWKDGQQIAEYDGPTGYNDLRGTYMKIGSYHPGIDRTVYIDNVRIAYTPSEIVEQ